MSYGPRATKTNDNAESCVGTKKKPLVRWMATPNVVAKESLVADRLWPEGYKDK